ncbi:Telomerase protein component 1 [Paramecium bursaria]
MFQSFRQLKYILVLCKINNQIRQVNHQYFLTLFQLKAVFQQVYQILQNNLVNRLSNNVDQYSIQNIRNNCRIIEQFILYERIQNIIKFYKKHIMYSELLKHFKDSEIQQIKDPRLLLINIASAAFMKEIQFNTEISEMRDQLFDSLLLVADQHPEFILQLANYTRNYLFCRSSTNFILAFATQYDSTRPFCKKYFDQCVKLPSDIIEICQFHQIVFCYLQNKWIAFNNDYQRIIDKEFKPRSLFTFTKTLQKVVAEKFQKFDLHQLGKYSSESRRKYLLRRYQEIHNFQYLQRQIKRRFKKNKQKELFIKKLTKNKRRTIRKQHTQIQRKKIQKRRKFQRITNCIGRQFLTFKDVIRRCHISKPKFVIECILGCKYPKTNDEFVQRYGEKDDLVFNEAMIGKRMKLPIPETWDRELSKKQQKENKIWEGLIEKNQIPYLALVRNLRNIIKSGCHLKYHQLVMERLCNPQIVKHSKFQPLQYYKTIQEINKLTETFQVKHSNVKQQQMIQFTDKEQSVQYHLLQDYVRALEEALQLSIKYLKFISGKTLIFLNPTTSSRLQLFEIVQIIRAKCEYCEIYIIGGSNGREPYLKVNFSDESITEGIKKIEQQYNNIVPGNLIGWALRDLVFRPSIHYDQILIFSDLSKPELFSYKEDSIGPQMKEYLDFYHTKFYFIDVTGGAMEINCQQQNIILLSGLTDKIVDFIALQQDQIQQIINFAQ